MAVTDFLRGRRPQPGDYLGLLREALGGEGSTTGLQLVDGDEGLGSPRKRHRTRDSSQYTHDYRDGACWS